MTRLGERIHREAGYLYYLGKDGYVWRAPMKNNPHGTKQRIGNTHVARKAGVFYFIDGEGYVCERNR